jgi:hypothetical protein
MAKIKNMICKACNTSKPTSQMVSNKLCKGCMKKGKR